MDRVAYIINRLIQMIPTVLIITILVFLTIHLIPGDPAEILLGIEATPETVSILREHMGLDKPLYEQFFIFLQNLSKGDLGESIIIKIPVLELIKMRLPTTLFIVGYATVIAVVLSVPLALLSAIYRDTLLDQVIRWFNVGILATPSFWLGILLLIFLGIKIPLFPVGGLGGGGVLDKLRYLFLPSLTIGLHLCAIISRNLRDQLIATMTSDHVTFAKAKGLKGNHVFIRHVLRNAAVTSSTLLFLQIGWLVGGSVIVETVFAIPGMGWTIITAILGRDYAVVQGATLTFAFFVSIINIFSDIVYSLLDPRVSL